MRDIIAEARKWLAENTGIPGIDSMTDAGVTGAIRRHYAGGLAAFIADGAR